MCQNVFCFRKNVLYLTILKLSTLRSKRQKYYFQIVILVAIFATSNLSYTQLPNYVTEDALLAWWSFEQNALDKSQNNHNGNISNVNFDIDANGNLNSSANFHGIPTSFVRVNHTEKLNFPPSQDFTVSMWIKVASNPNNGPKSGILTKWNENQNNFSYPYRVASTDLGNGTSEIVWENYHSPTYTQNTISTIVDNNRYIHLTFVVKNHTVSIYRNGIYESSKTFQDRDYRNSFDIFIGKRNIVTQRNFRGNIDELGIWNRALNDCEIYALYQRSSDNSLIVEVINNAGILYHINYNNLNLSYQWFKCLDNGEIENIENANSDSYEPIEAGNYGLQISFSNSDCLAYSDCIEFTPLATKQELKEIISFNLYPNPANQFVIFELSTDKSISTESIIIDSQGRQVATQSIVSGENSISTEHLSKGTYLLIIPELGITSRFLISK